MMTFIASVIKLWLTGSYWVDIMDEKIDMMMIKKMDLLHIWGLKTLKFVKCKKNRSVSM